MARKGISVKSHPTLVANPALVTIVEFFDWNTGQSGKIEFYSTPARNLAVTVFGHTERVRLEEGRKQT